MSNYLINEWISAATRGLCAEAREQITREILDHYHDCVAEEMKNGRSVDHACLTAIDGLGSAEAARRDYRRAHLTEKEAALLQYQLVRPGADPSKVRALLRWAALMGVLASWSAAQSVIRFAELLSLTTLYLAFFAWAMTAKPGDALRRRGRRRLAWALDHTASNYYSFVVFLFWMGDLHSGGVTYFSRLMIVSVCVCEALEISRIVALEIKLRRLHYPRNG